MKTTLTTIIIAMALSCSVTFARIGETFSQAVERYGPVRATDKISWTGDPMYLFIKGDFFVSVVFGADGRICWIQYVKQGPSKIRWYDELTEVEQENFRQSNASDWKPFGYQMWQTSDLLATYEYFMDSPGESYYRMLIWTKDYATELAAAKAAEETTAQTGF